MKCRYCGRVVVCATCGAAVEEGGATGRVVLPDDSTGLGTAAPSDPASSERTFLIVARGHGDLLDQLREVVGDLGWVRLLEDRRTDETLLPREGRGGTVHVDPETTP